MVKIAPSILSADFTRRVVLAMRFYADEQFPTGRVAHLRRKHGVRFVAEESELRRLDDVFHHQRAKSCRAWEPGRLNPKYRKINAILDQTLRRFRYLHYRTLLSGARPDGKKASAD